MIEILNKEKYPRLEELGVEVIDDPQKGPPGVNWIQLQLALNNAGFSIEQFCNYYGVQTAGENGMYPWDVEAVLERMMSGKLQGTQLLWD